MNTVWSAIINGAILSAVLAAAVWAAMLPAPRRFWNARARHLVWWIALALTVALPLWSALALRTASAELGSRPLPASGAQRASTAKTASEVMVDVKPWMPASSRTAFELPSGPWQGWLLCIWMICSALMLLRLGLSYRALRRAGAEADAAPDELRERASAWAAALGIDAGALRVASSKVLAIPVAFGPRRTVLIPSVLLDELSADELDYVGLHEAAHLARRDDLSLMVQRTVEAIFCLHPVVRWIARRIDLEREIACDDLAVSVSGKPQSYGACLTRMAQLCGGEGGSLASATFVPHRPHLSQRVELIMNQTRTSVPQRLAPQAAAAALAICALAGVLANRPALVAFAAPQPAAPASPTRHVQVASAFSPQAEALPQVRTTPNDARGALILLFEASALSANNLANAVRLAETAVERQVTGARQAAVMQSSGSRLLVRQDFTTDHGLLRRALDGLVEAPAGAVDDSTRKMDTIERAIDMVKPLAGKKVVMYFAANTLHAAEDSGQVKSVIDAAVHANVAIVPVAVESQKEDPPAYVLGAGDRIGIAVFGRGALGGEQVIRPDGKITVTTGEVMAAGITPGQLAGALAVRFRDLVPDPKVSVTVLEVVNRRYFIQGEMAKSGEFPLVTPIRVLEALVKAGGFRGSSPGKIAILRGAERLPFNYKEVVNGKRLEQNIFLMPGDIILVR